MASKKIFDHGFWKSKLFYYQSLIYYYVSSIKFKSIVWFASINPAIHMGGMLDESKEDIYDLILEKYLPNTTCIKSHQKIDGDLFSTFSFPVIAKPDIGLKGWKVIKIFSLNELLKHLHLYSDIDWIVQEFITYEMEYAILCTKDPLTQKVDITSVTHKVYPSVKGDGFCTLEQLTKQKNDAYLNIDEIKEINASRWLDVIPENEEIVLHNIGNYSRGSKFYNANDLIDHTLVNAFTPLMLSLNDIYFCRFDLKTPSVSEMKNGVFKILEMNGAKSEPLHIYDPKVSWIKAVKDIHAHWHIMSKIASSQLNIKKVVLPTAQQGLEALKGVKKVFDQ